jgi:hypothetical protein
LRGPPYRCINNPGEFVLSGGGTDLGGTEYIGAWCSAALHRRSVRTTTENNVKNVELGEAEFLGCPKVKSLDRSAFAERPIQLARMKNKVPTATGSYGG